jgi:hypothetical protein
MPSSTPESGPLTVRWNKSDRSILRPSAARICARNQQHGSPGAGKQTDAASRFGLCVDAFQAAEFDQRADPGVLRRPMAKPPRNRNHPLARTIGIGDRVADPGIIGLHVQRGPQPTGRQRPAFGWRRAADRVQLTAAGSRRRVKPPRAARWFSTDRCVPWTNMALSSMPISACHVKQRQSWMSWNLFAVMLSDGLIKLPDL